LLRIAFFTVVAAALALALALWLMGIRKRRQRRSIRAMRTSEYAERDELWRSYVQEQDPAPLPPAGPGEKTNE